MDGDYGPCLLLDGRNALKLLSETCVENHFHGCYVAVKFDI